MYSDILILYLNISRIVFKIIFKIKLVFGYSYPLSQQYQDCIIFKIIFKIKHVLRYSYPLSQYFQDY